MRSVAPSQLGDVVGTLRFVADVLDREGAVGDVAEVERAMLAAVLNFYVASRGPSIGLAALRRDVALLSPGPFAS